MLYKYIYIIDLETYTKYNTFIDLYYMQHINFIFYIYIIYLYTHIYIYTYIYSVSKLPCIFSTSGKHWDSLIKLKILLGLNWHYIKFFNYLE